MNQSTNQVVVFGVVSYDSTRIGPGQLTLKRTHIHTHTNWSRMDTDEIATISLAPLGRGVARPTEEILTLLEMAKIRPVTPRLARVWSREEHLRQKESNRVKIQCRA